jgi:hypothetical protein
VSDARLAEMSAVELEISTDVAQLYYGIQTTYQLIELLNESRAVAAFAVQPHEARAARGLESRTELEAAHGRRPVSGNASTKRCWPNRAAAANSIWSAPSSTVLLFAPYRREKNGPNPTDRRKLGSKHHLIVEAQGIPLAVILSGANCHDIKQLNALVSAIPPIRGKPGRPLRKPDIAQDDRGYSSNKHRQALREQGIVPELTRIGAPHAVAAWAKRAGSSSALLRGCITIDA